MKKKNSIGVTDKSTPPTPEKSSSWIRLRYKCTDCGYKGVAVTQIGEFAFCGECGSMFLEANSQRADMGVELT